MNNDVTLDRINKGKCAMVEGASKDRRLRAASHNGLFLLVSHGRVRLARFVFNVCIYLGS